MTLKWQGDRNDAYVSIGHIDLNAWRIGSKFHWSVSTCGVEGETMAQADEPTMARAKVAAVNATRILLSELLESLPQPDIGRRVADILDDVRRKQAILNANPSMETP